MAHVALLTLSPKQAKTIRLALLSGRRERRPHTRTYRPRACCLPTIPRLKTRSGQRCRQGLGSSLALAHFRMVSAAPAASHLETDSRAMFRHRCVRPQNGFIRPPNCFVAGRSDETRLKHLRWPAERALPVLSRGPQMTLPLTSSRHRAALVRLDREWAEARRSC